MSDTNLPALDPLAEYFPDGLAPPRDPLKTQEQAHDRTPLLPTPLAPPRAPTVPEH